MSENDTNNDNNKLDKRGTNPKSLSNLNPFARKGTGKRNKVTKTFIQDSIDWLALDLKDTIKQIKSLPVEKQLKWKFELAKLVLPRLKDVTTTNTENLVEWQINAASTTVKPMQTITITPASEAKKEDND